MNDDLIPFEASATRHAAVALYVLVRLETLSENLHRDSEFVLKSYPIWLMIDKIAYRIQYLWSRKWCLEHDSVHAAFSAMRTSSWGLSRFLGMILFSLYSSQECRRCQRRHRVNEILWQNGDWIQCHAVPLSRVGLSSCLFSTVFRNTSICLYCRCLRYSYGILCKLHSRKDWINHQLRCLIKDFGFRIWFEWMEAWVFHFSLLICRFFPE